MNYSSPTEAVHARGIPAPGSPRFTLPAENVTTDEGEFKSLPALDFMDILVQGGSAVFIIPLIVLVEHVAVCKSFGAFRNKGFMNLHQTRYNR